MEVGIGINTELFWSSIYTCLHEERLQKPKSYEDVMGAFLAGVFVIFEHCTCILMSLADGIGAYKTSDLLKRMKYS